MNSTTWRCDLQSTRINWSTSLRLSIHIISFVFSSFFYSHIFPILIVIISSIMENLSFDIHIFAFYHILRHTPTSKPTFDSLFLWSNKSSYTPNLTPLSFSTIRIHILLESDSPSALYCFIDFPFVFSALFSSWIFLKRREYFFFFWNFKGISIDYWWSFHFVSLGFSLGFICYLHSNRKRKPIRLDHDRKFSVKAILFHLYRCHSII